MEFFGVSRPEDNEREDETPSGVRWIIWKGLYDKDMDEDSESMDGEKILKEFWESQPELMETLVEIDRLKRMKDIIKDRENIYPKVIAHFKTIEQTVNEIVNKYPEHAEDIIVNSGIYFDLSRMPYALLDFEDEHERTDKRLIKQIVPIYYLGQDVRGVEVSMYRKWYSLSELGKIYPGLFKDWDTIITEINEEAFKTIKREVLEEVNGEISKKYGEMEAFGKDSGMIEDIELVKKLSKLELFFLAEALDSHQWNMPDIDSYHDEEDEEMTAFLKTIHVEKEEEKIRSTRDFLLSQVGYSDVDELGQWFFDNQRFFFSGNHNRHKLEKPLLLKLLIEVEKSRREKGEPSLENLLPIDSLEKEKAPRGHLFYSL
jgi:hypothetical protein